MCPLAKQKRLFFSSSNNMSVSAFDLLHLDIWGLFRVPTVDGYKYFLTIVDDCTKVTWVYLLKDKSSVITVFPEFLTFVETQFKTSVKTIQTDNAPEHSFTSKKKTKAYNITFHVLPLHNRTLLWKENISISLMWLAHYSFNLTFLLTIGGIAFKQQFI